MSRRRKEASPLPTGRRRVVRVWTGDPAHASSLDPDRNLHVMLQHMEDTANAILAGKTPRAHAQNRDLARQVIDLIGEARKFLDGLSPLDRQHVFDLLWLAQGFADLEADLNWSGAVDSRRRSDQALDRKRHKGTAKRTEREIRAALRADLSNKEIAERLDVSLKTVSNYKKKYAQG